MKNEKQLISDFAKLKIYNIINNELITDENAIDLISDILKICKIYSRKIITFDEAIKKLANI